MYEIFEDCIYDIDMWINEVYKLGYKRIILAGHSFGCNKIIYYNYKIKPDITGIILASPPDMSPTDKNHNSLINKALENIRNKKPLDLVGIVDDYMYYSSQTYYNWYKEDSNANNLPIIKNPKIFKQFHKIDVPILAFAGLDEEDMYLHLDLLKEKAVNCIEFTYEYIKNANHFYNGCEIETAQIILNYIKYRYMED